MSAIDMTFRDMSPPEELVDTIRSTCTLVGESIADGARWRVRVERHESGVALSRLEIHLGGPARRIAVSAAHPDPILSVQRAFARLLGHPQLAVTPPPG